MLIKRNINAIPYNFHFHFLSYFYATVPKGKNSTYVCKLPIYRMSPPAMKEEALITVIERKQSFMDQRTLVASLFIWSTYSKCPLLIMPTKLKAMPCNGREFQYNPRHSAISLYLTLLKGDQFCPRCFTDLYLNKEQKQRLCRNTEQKPNDNVE